MRSTGPSRDTSKCLATSNPTNGPPTSTNDEWSGDLLTIAETARGGPYPLPGRGHLQPVPADTDEAAPLEAARRCAKTVQALERQAFEERKDIDKDTFVSKVFDEPQIAAALEHVWTESAQFLERELSLPQLNCGHMLSRRNAIHPTSGARQGRALEPSKPRPGQWAVGGSRRDNRGDRSPECLEPDWVGGRRRGRRHQHHVVGARLRWGSARRVSRKAACRSTIQGYLRWPHRDPQYLRPHREGLRRRRAIRGVEGSCAQR